MVLIRLRMDGEILGHEPDFHVRFDSAFQIRVENVIKDRPVVNRIALRIFAVGACRTPLQRRRAVAGSQQIVRAEIHSLRRELAEFADQLLAVFHGGIIRFVGSEEPPDRMQFADGFAGIHANGDTKRVRCGRRVRCEFGSLECACESEDQQQRGDDSLHG